MIKTMTNNEKIPIRQINIKKQLDNVKNWEISSEDKKSIKDYIRDLQIGKITGNQPCAGTLTGYLSNLRIALEFMNKPTSQLKPKETEGLCEALLKDSLKYIFKKKNNDGKTIHHKKPYSESGKIKIKNAAILYLNWKLGDKSSSLIKILKVKPKLKERTPDYLREEQVEKLYKACKTSEERYLIAMLFDSGARAEEFFNIRREDLQLPKGEDNFVKLSLKEEYSKTKGRTIGLYWKYCLEGVRDYLNQRISEGIQGDEPVFKNNYKNTLKFLKRLGNKALGRSIHFHLFRHSSATYYANKLNRQELCIRYGWKFRSPCPDIYISRDLGKKEIDEKFERTQIGELKGELEKQKQLNKIKQEELENKNQELVIEIHNMSKDYNRVVKEMREAILNMRRLNVTENY
jgi:integrase